MVLLQGLIFRPFFLEFALFHGQILARLSEDESLMVEKVEPGEILCFGTDDLAVEHDIDVAAEKKLLFGFDFR